MTSNLHSVAICLALIVLATVLWLFVQPERAYACTCAPPGSPSEALTYSDAVFRGKVVSIREVERDDGIWSSTDPTTVEFNVTNVWKGSVSQTLFLTTPRSEVSCGFTFIEGGEYVVYAFEDSTVGLCSRTRPLWTAAEDLAVLGPGQAPAPDTIAPTPDVSNNQTGGGCGPSPYTPDVTVVGLLVGTAWLGLRKRRSARQSNRQRSGAESVIHGQSRGAARLTRPDIPTSGSSDRAVQQ